MNLHDIEERQDTESIENPLVAGRGECTDKSIDYHDEDEK